MIICHFESALRCLYVHLFLFRTHYNGFRCVRVCSSICWAPHAQSSSANMRNFTRTNVRIWRRVWNNSLNAYFARTINSPLQLNNWPIGQFHVITTCAVVQERCERSNSSSMRWITAFMCLYPRSLQWTQYIEAHTRTQSGTLRTPTYIHARASCIFFCRPHNAQL